MANLTKPQGLSCKKPFFVNYAKMLCKHNYVNRINEESGGSREPAQSAICGRGRKNRAQYIGSAPDGPQAVRGGLPRQGFLGETKNFVILTMLFFMSPPSVGCGAARPLPCSTGPCLPLSLFPARQPCQHRTAEDGPCQQRAVCGKICLAADGYQPHHRVQAHRHRQALGSGGALLLRMALRPPIITAAT